MHKTFGDFKRSLDQRDVETQRELKKLKTDSKAASSRQFKGNRIQFEFNTQLLDCLNLAISNLSEGNLLAVQEHLQKAKSDLEKPIKLIRVADKSPADWAAVEEFASDELAENSEDEKKLRAAERRALTKIKQKSCKPRVSRFSNISKSRDFLVTQVPGSSASATPLPSSSRALTFVGPFVSSDKSSLPTSALTAISEDTGLIRQLPRLAPVQRPQSHPSSDITNVLARLGPDKYSDFDF